MIVVAGGVSLGGCEGSVLGGNVRGVVNGYVQVPLEEEGKGRGQTVLRSLKIGGLNGAVVSAADVAVVIAVVSLVFLLGLAVIEVFALFMVGLVFSIALGILVAHIALVI